MAVEAVVDAVVTFVREHEGWAMPVAFMIAFAESFCFVSIVVPGTAMLVGIAALLAASGVEASIVVPAIVAAGLGGTLGYAVSYWIGLYFKDRIETIWPFTTRPHLIEQGRTFFEEYGALGVFIGHFFGPVRAVIPVVAGAFGMRQLPFQIANAASAFIWAGGVIAPSFYVVSFREEIMAMMNAHEPLVAAMIFVLAVANSIARPMLFLPTLVLFMALGALHLFANGDFIILWLAGAAGAFAGDLYAYYSGHRHRADINGAWPLAAAKAQHVQAQKLIESSGALSILISKFQGFNRGLVPLEAGVIGFALAPFVAMSALSALLWALAYLAPALFVGYISD